MNVSSTITHSVPLPWHTPHLSSTASEPSTQSHPTNRQIPATHISLVPSLQRVPSFTVCARVLIMPASFIHCSLHAFCGSVLRSGVHLCLSLSCWLHCCSLKVAASGSGGLLLHTWYFLRSPKQYLPWFRGAGSLQSRSLKLIHPPLVLEQVDHGPHVPHPPFLACGLCPFGTHFLL